LCCLHDSTRILYSVALQIFEVWNFSPLKPCYTYFLVLTSMSWNL
jgi:hypothetical protein